MSNFPPPAAEDVIYREGRRRPRWVPLAAATAVVVALGVVGVVAFGGDDGSAAKDPWTLLRVDPASGAVDAVGADGDTATFESLGTMAGLGTGTIRAVDDTSSLLAAVGEGGVVTVLDAATGEIRTISTGADLHAATRLGDTLIATDAVGSGTFVDLRAGTSMTLQRAFGVASDVELFIATPGRNGAVIVIGNGGAVVYLATDPASHQWFDGKVYDASGTRVLVGSIGTERTVSLFSNGEQVGEPMALASSGRARLMDGKDAALVLQDDGTILTLDFTNGRTTTTGHVPDEVMGALPDGLVSAYLLGDARILVEVNGGWALVNTAGSLLASYTAGGIEPGATDLAPRYLGPSCVVLAVSGGVPDRSALIDLDTGKVLIDVAGSVYGGTSDDGCSFVSTGTTQILIVDGAVVDVPGDLVAMSPDYTEAIVRATDGGAVVDRMVTRYHVVKGALADPVELGAGAYLYLFVPSSG